MIAAIHLLSDAKSMVFSSLRFRVYKLAISFFADADALRQIEPKLQPAVDASFVVKYQVKFFPSLAWGNLEILIYAQAVGRPAYMA